MPPTIDDVAREAGVGIGTVSRVLNGNPFVKEGTRQRVLAAVERLGYRPSPTARAFGRRRTHILEILVPVFASGFFLEVVRGVEAALARSPYTLQVRTIEGADDRERVFGGGRSPESFGDVTHALPRFSSEWVSGQRFWRNDFP